MMAKRPATRTRNNALWVKQTGSQSGTAPQPGHRRQSLLNRRDLIVINHILSGLAWNG